MFKSTHKIIKNHLVQSPEQPHIELCARRCPVCGAEDHRPVLSDINRREGLDISCTLVRCYGCGTDYLNPAPTPESLDRLYSTGFVDPLGDSSSVDTLWQDRKRSLAYRMNELLRGHPHDWPMTDTVPAKILDFGCFDASKLMPFHQAGWRVAGIDLNEPAISRARTHMPEGDFWCADLLDIQIEERFDYIRSDNVIEHLLEPLPYVSALKELLLPGGRIRIFVPNGRALSIRLFGKYSAMYWMPFHLTMFTASSLSRLLERSGFQDIECSTFSPVGSWSWTQQQLLRRPGFKNDPSRLIDGALSRLRLLNYPGETLAQWCGAGEELVVTASRA